MQKNSAPELSRQNCYNMLGVLVDTSPSGLLWIRETDLRIRNRFVYLQVDEFFQLMYFTTGVV